MRSLPPPWTGRAAAALLLALAACGGGGGKKDPAPTFSSVVLVAPNPAALAIGRSLRLGAVARYSDGSGVNVTTTATFDSSDVATVQVVGRDLQGRGGRFQAAPGAQASQWVNVTATWGGKTSAPVRLTLVNPVAVGPGHDDDPLLDQQWHLAATAALRNGVRQTGFARDATGGQWDLNAAAYAHAQGYAGLGVKVAVVDSGLELAHEDLADNVVAGSWNFTAHTGDPTTARASGDHGTSVAGLIAAVNGNGLGGMGVAPWASLNGYNLLDQDTNQTLANYVAALGAGTGVNGPRSTDVWVFNQSFGVSDVAPIPVNATVEALYWDGVTHLRGGLGAVFVKAAGNGFEPTGAPGSVCAAGLSCENASMDPSNTLPPNVVVGAFNAAGTRSSYSTAGSAIWVSNLGGEYGGVSCPGGGCGGDFYAPAMVTVDQSGCGAGYSPRGAGVGGDGTDRFWPQPLSGFNAGNHFDPYLAATVNPTCGYVNTFNGTSSAAPVTSGVVALMLEANPSLTWREVKYLLATTATQVDAARPDFTIAVSNGTYVAEPAWHVNAAGHPFHNWYGFGLVDASAAVQAAEGWTPGVLGTLANTGWLAGAVTAAAIPDDSLTGAAGALTVSRALAVEAVQVRVVTNHPYLGDLGIELVSPSGTRSVLLNALNAYQRSSGAVTLQLASNTFLDEASQGTWQLKVVDAAAGDAGSVLGWSMRIYGH